MVVLLSSRPLVSRLLARSTRTFTRRSAVKPIPRVSFHCSGTKEQSNNGSAWLDLAASSKHARTYATESSKPASRPKAHTGRTPAKRTATTKTTTPTKKKTAKPKKKKVAKKPKPKTRAKKAPTKASIARDARKSRSDLRAKALLDEPKQLPRTAYMLILVEESQKAGGIKTGSPSASQRYRSLSPEERERYNHQANENQEKNRVAYKKWVQSITPLQTKQANNARRLLNKRILAAGMKQKVPLIQDDRRVKGRRNGYTFFFAERHSSGDLKGMTLAESGKLVGKEWKEMSASEKKPYTDKAEADKARYVEEYRTVYGLEPAASSKPSAQAL
ncbi:hypothetical protein H2202_006612 [Exophiala xenobiotica]|nr:hypothetical protein H2202_006612 [Exophiala xenobiotica]KAK5221958.1 hypothetical protein LTR72_006214 [Exophiala xenobiotica]KAK5235725.1 hypothetical protein LTR47_003199 [Exophiala xenobiotica]KAK5250487.1 hypothetical protein LTS06_004740 [Exophiala xenobiotica]KAK5262190.1 hypothetical protein LTR40_000756 [Exophiala xenobiotica]